MKLFQWFLAALVAAFSVHAHAQRMPVPVVDFIDVPVPATAQPVTAEQVKGAFLRAAATLNWEITPEADGVLQARFVKDFKHTVVATVRYDAKAWSLVYKNSDNMKFDEGPNVAATGGNAPSSNLLRSAYQSQKQKFADDPLSAYAVVRERGALHPFYEVWVRRLMTAATAELRTL